MRDGISTAIVIAKEPLPNQVKTRLVPPLSPQDAAAVAAAALVDTLRAVDALAVEHRLLAFAGDAEAWTPRGWRTVVQPDGGLDLRLAAAFGAAERGPAVLVGMDTPQLRPEQVTAWEPDRYDACLGLASDGGFWAIGFRDPGRAAQAIPGVPMSTEGTGAEQLARLHALGLNVQLLDELTDVDTVDTAHEVARVAPSTQFARMFAQITSVVS